jgi:murein DD-endopeptidase MepM/ murein hydrolase activator NlpD
VAFNLKKAFVFDLTQKNKELASINVADVHEFSAYIKRKLQENNKDVGIGRYNEDRTIYHTPLFSGQRTVHLGIDIWAPARTEIFSPIAGVVHSFQNNVGEGDYGPTIILQHTVEGNTFYTLYGHLTLNSLHHMFKGKHIQCGEKIAEIGSPPANGNYPPHLHFQLITDMLGREGNFPGVASVEEQEYWLSVCPDPSMFLNL